MSEKARHTVWLPDDIWNKVESHYQADNCSTKNEYIEKAIRFYTDYLNAQNASNYLPHLISEMLDAKLDTLGDRIGRLLFKLTVEESMMMHIIACDTDIDAPTLDRLRGRCVNDAKRTNGEISFKEILKFQKSL